MNQEELASSLETLYQRVQEKWEREHREEVLNTFAKANINSLPQLITRDEYAQGVAGLKVQNNSEKLSSSSDSPYTYDFWENDILERAKSSLKSNNSLVYPDYFQKMLDGLRDGNLDNFYAYLGKEGLKWALMEIPVNDLVSQANSYIQEFVDALYNNELLDICLENRRELVHLLDKISQKSQAVFVKGYLEGYDQLLMKSFSSHYTPDSNNTYSSPTHGTFMKDFGQQVRRSLDELEGLHKVNSAVNSSLDQDSVLDLTVASVAEVMVVDVCSIYVFERDPQFGQEKMVLRAAQGLNQKAIGNSEVRVGEGITGLAAKEGQPIAVDDVRADWRFQYIPQLRDEDVRSMLSVPVILYTREKLVGVINVQSRTYRSWATEEIRFLEMVAGEIALAIENARLYQQTDERLRQKVYELTTLQKVSNLIAATLDLNRVLDLIVQQAAQLVKTEMASIYELKEGSHYLSIVASHGLSADYVNNMKVLMGEGPVGRAAELVRPVNVWDAHFELHRGEEYFINGQFRSAMCVPLAGARGVLGVICLYTRDQRHFNDEQLQIISAFADQAAIAIENARLYEEARRGLSIKSALLQEMHHRVRNNLQTVAALLSMQMRRTNEQAVAIPLAESVARIQSIAAVHDLLCREDIGVTTVYSVTKEIMDIASINLVPPDKRIRFKIDEGKVPIASKEATLLAILIMELLSNAIFHGFRDRNEGEVRVNSFSEGGRTQIEIRDNGVGYPPGFDPETCNYGLGLQIVKTLVTKDLQGALKMENKNGWATATIIFNSVYGQDTVNDINTGLIA